MLVVLAVVLAVSIGTFMLSSFTGGSGKIYVVDESDSPIEGAEITFIKIKVYGFWYNITLKIGSTDANGLCSFSTSQLGLYAFKAEKESYETATGEVDVNPYGEATVQLIFITEAYGKIKIDVFVEGDLQNDIPVTIEGIGEVVPPVEVDVKAGEYQLSCTYLGKTTEKTVRVEEGATTETKFEFFIDSEVGYLDVRAFLGEGKEKEELDGLKVLVEGDGYTSIFTTPKMQEELPVGECKVSVTYKSKTKSETVMINNQETTKVNFYFKESLLNEFIEWLNWIWSDFKLWLSEVW